MGKRGKHQGSLTTSSQPDPLALTTPFLAVVLMHIFGWLFPGNATWGFSFWSEVNPAVAICVFVASILLLIPPITRYVARQLRILDIFARLIKRTGKAGALVLLSAAMLLIFYYFRSKALVYGDGFTVLNEADGTEPIILLFQYKFQILSIYFYRYAFYFFKDLTGLEPQQLYSLINAVGGVLGMWALVRISGQITSHKTSRVFVFVGSLTSASVLLFFGYIENYTWALALALWTVSLAIGYSKRENGLIGLLLVACVALMLHMVTLPFVLVALMSLFMRSSPSGTYLFGIRLAVFNSIIVAGSLVLVTLSQVADIDIFVSLVPIAGNPYWILSPAHLLDMLNEFALVASFGVVILIFERFHSWKRAQAIGPIDGILASATLFTLLVTFWIDPGIGAPRDWDLLSFVGLPLTLWALYRFTKIFPAREIPARWIVAVVVILCVQLGANLYEKNRPDLAIARLSALLDDDIHYQESYKQAQRCLPWAVILYKSLNRGDLAIEHFKRRLGAIGECHRSCFHLGDIYAEVGEYDSAAKYLEIGTQTMPHDTRVLVNMSIIEKLRGRYVSSVDWARRAVELEPSNVEALTTLGTSLCYCERADESLPYFRQACRLSPGSFGHLANLGYCFQLIGHIDSAYYYVHEALQLAPVEKAAGLYVYVITMALELNRPNDAAEHLDELRQVAPDTPEIGELAAKLEQ